MKRIYVLFVVLLSAPGMLPLRAQLVNDGATNVLSNVTNSPSNLTVGTNGSFTLLVVSNNALLNNTANGVIGRNASAQSNEVRITGATARWSMASFANLYVGSNGAANRLTVSDGGLMQNFFFGNIGQYPSSSNNSVLITDPGSLWSGSLLFLGASGAGNQLTVSNGATVYTGGGTVGFASTASNTLVTVTGAGSLWTNDGGVTIGSASSGNRVIVNAGGRLGGNGILGLDAVANNNTVLLTDSGSSWTNPGSVQVGAGGSGNQLIASNGASIYVAGNAFVGLNSTASSNSLILTDPGSRFFKGLNTDITIGSNSPFNRLVLSNGAVADCRMGELGFATGGATNEAVVTGPGSAWRTTLDTIVGRNGARNRLTISNGGFVSSLSGVLGLSPGGINNEAIVTGPGSLWTNVNNLTIGDQGSGNRLVVSNGAAVFADGDGTIGGNPSARSNSVVVTDAGSSLTVASAHLFVGRNGPFSQLIITNGARVMNSVGSSSMGDSPDGSNNLVLVTGPGSMLTNRISLTIGSASDANRLVVTNGAQVQGRHGTIGLNFNRNEAVVTGAGSLWNNGEELVVGASANGSRLVVSDGGTVVAGTNVILGRFDFGSLGNRATVDGGTLKVTNASATGTLDIRRGTNVFNAGLIDVDQLVMTNRGANPSPTTFGSSGGLINIPSGSPASPYPSSIAVSGLSGNVTGVTVQLFFLSHTFPDDLDIVLLSPAGQKVMLMSDAGSDSNADAISNVNLTFSDAASTFLSDFTTIVSGTYRPTDYQPGETLPNPAPPGPYSTSLSSFIGASPNGTWRLYINDDANPDSGSLGGWAVSITTDADPTRAGVFEFNGGTLVTRGAVINNNLPFAVGASGINPAVWDVRPGTSDHRVFGDLIVGENSSFNQLLLTNGAVASVGGSAFLGVNSGSTNNRIVVDGGMLQATNAAVTGLLEVRRGTNVLNAGLIEADIVRMTNSPQSVLEFNGGTLSAKSSKISSGTILRLGNGVSPATMFLAGNGVHDFSGNLTVRVSSNAVLTGNGTLLGGFQILSGGTLSPGASVGKMIFSNSPSLQGATVMEISKNGATLTNDQIQVPALLTYGGSLVVTNLGPTALAAGDNYRLFVASSYAGSFSNLSLPALGPDLIWTDKLLVDGSIEVTSTLPGDHFWTNSLGGNYNNATNWLLNSIPGPSDHAIFTNNASYKVSWPADASAADAFFNANSGTVTQVMSATTWLLTNSYIVGRDPSAVASVTHTTGALRVTNSAGDARLIVGQSGRGTFQLNGGDVLADYLFVTNNGSSFTNSTFNFNFGNLTTLQGSVVTQNTSFVIGNVSNQTATWTMPRGTNVIATDGSSQTVLGNSPGSRGVVVASGSSTLWSNSGFLVIGGSGSASQMTVSNGARLENGPASIGDGNSSSNNEVVITGTGSIWSNRNSLFVGASGSGNRLVVSNGGRVDSIIGDIGRLSSSTNNETIVTGPGSDWAIFSTLFVGNLGNGNRLVVSNGGQVESFVAQIGVGTSGGNNEALVTGAGSIWSSPALLAVGQLGSGNRLVVSNGAVVSTEGAAIVGSEAFSTNNRVVVDGGTLRATNISGAGLLDIRRGTNILNAGLVEVDQLRLTNAQGFFEFNGGTLQSGNTTVSNLTSFVVGNGISPATFELVGGTHSFANGLSVSSNGLLKGSGSVTGNVQVSGALAPGASVGQIALAGALSFQPGSTANFELNKASATNDSVIGLTNLFYHGTLAVTNLAGTLANGDSFKLFDFTSRLASAFTNLILPALDPGLKWRNKLMMDGSLQVITIPTRDFGVDVSHFQGASGISQASWNQMFAEGKRFAFIKATEGLTGPHDGAMSNNVARASAAGLLAGVYHYAHPENRPTTNGAILEASNMVVYAGSAIGPGRLRPVLDIEGAALTLSTTALTDWVIAFSDEIIARRGPGAAPIIYCSQSAANFEFDSRLANYDLWLRTIGGSDPATDDPINTLGFDPTGVFNEWSFWQYSDTGSSGGISPLDLDVCHSEYKPLSSFLIPGAPPSPIQLAGMTVTTNGTFKFSFTNTPGALFTVLATTNVALPLSTWPALGSVTEISPGQFLFTDSQATNHPRRFYGVRSP